MQERFLQMYRSKSMKCTNCGHPQYAHLLEGEGQCQYWIIKSMSDFYRTDTFGKDTKTWTTDIEYEGQCPCKGVKQPLIKSSNLDSFFSS
jgi:hypothetical protein